MIHSICFKKLSVHYILIHLVTAFGGFGNYYLLLIIVILGAVIVSTKYLHSNKMYVCRYTF